MITIQHIYKHSETKEMKSYFNPITGQYKDFETIPEATAQRIGNGLKMSDNKDYLTNISIVRQYNEAGTKILQQVYSHN